MAVADELERLHKIFEAGGLTDDEYALAKYRVLNAEAASGSGTSDSTTSSPGPPTPPSGNFLQQFQRTPDDEWIGGVCGGLGRVTPFPSWLWRLVFVGLFFAWGIGFFTYVLLWIFVPAMPKAKVPEVLPPSRPEC